MARVNYTDEQEQEFCVTAQEIGIGAAMRELGYPASHHTAKKWLIGRGIEITLDTLKQEAQATGVFYGVKEKTIGAQKIVDRIVAMLETEDLDAEEINKLTNAYYKAMQTMNLIDGLATERKENVQRDEMDSEIAKLVADARANNEDKQRAISGD